MNAHHPHRRIRTQRPLVEALPHETLIEVAGREGIEIPRLCYKEGMEAVGNCRSCMVEIDGERVLAPSCCRNPVAGMKVTTDSARAVSAQKMVLELLLADMPEAEYTRKNEVDVWAEKLGLGKPRFAPTRSQPQLDATHAAITVNLDACIQCTRCVRACRDEQVNDVIGLAFRGENAKIVFDQDDPLGASTCVACGECVQACPTGALMPARGVALNIPDKQVDSVCPYCGVGCQLTYNVKDNKILYVEGRDGPANHGRLCVKGRYGFDYAHHPHRLTKPLIRRAGVPKTGDFTMDPDRVLDVFREASWEEALALAAGKLGQIRDTHGGAALAGFGSAKGSNEEAYLFQKLVRTGFGTNNVDHCTRLCHASSVSALLEGIGSGAVSNPVMDVTRAEVIVIIGANPTVNHPVAATWIKNACQAGRQADRARPAPFRTRAPRAPLPAVQAGHRRRPAERDDARDRARAPGRRGLHRQPHGRLRRPGSERRRVQPGSDGADLRHRRRDHPLRGAPVRDLEGLDDPVGHGRVAARARHRQCALPDRAEFDDGPDRPSRHRPASAARPEQRAGRVRRRPDPDDAARLRRVDNPAVRAKFEAAWGATLDPNPGLTVVEIMDAIDAGQIRGMYIMGENPAMSDPDANHARAALAALEHLVVQDIFLTETAYLADVILPASAFPEKTGTFTNTDRLVQLGRQAIDPPGEAKQDLWIIQQMGQRLGLPWNYGHVSEVFDEMRRTMTSIGGITWERLEAEGAVVYPCLEEGAAGQPVVFTEVFPREGGRARFVPADIIPADERPTRPTRWC
jgi:formate dehydrogenase major subunit